MKNFIILFVLTFTYSAISQSLSVFDVDASNFPTIKAKFFAFDKDGKQITNLNTSDFEVKENGQPRSVTKVSCPAPQPTIALSSVLVFDVSGSMSAGPPRIQSAKNAANAWIDRLPLGKSECALVSFNEKSNIVQDFTTSRDKLKIAVNKLNPSGGTSYEQALIDLPAGGLQVAKNGKYKKVVIFLTDGMSNTTRVNEILKFAKENQITIYAVTLDMPAPQIIKEITQQTGGQYFENITTQKEAEETYRKLLQSAQGGQACEIEWESGITCKAGITNVEIKLPANQTFATTNYQSPVSSLAKLEFNPSSVKFLNPEVGVKVEEKVTVTAHNSDFTVTNIISNNPAFDIIPKSFVLKKGESKELRVSYVPTDSVYVFVRFDFETDVCPVTFFVSGGWSYIKPKFQTLKLTHPNGGEEFVIGSDTVITWEGIPESDTVLLEFTIDNGLTWETITDKASGLKYIWKNIPKPTSTQCKVRIKHNLNSNNSESSGELLHTLSGHNGFVYAVDWSPDGSRIATASTDNNARIWNAETGGILHTLSGHTNHVITVKWSPDGSRVATTSSDSTARIWDASNGNIIQVLDGHAHQVIDASWSPDGYHLVTGSSNRVRIWDASIGVLVHTLNSNASTVWDVEWSPDGTCVTNSCVDGTVQIWNAKTGNMLHKLNGHVRSVDVVKWSPDGTRVATASFDSTAIIWDAETGKIIFILKGHKHYVKNISWSTDGNRVATSSTDRTARIWDAGTGSSLKTLIGHYSEVMDVNWSPDGTRIATSSSDNTAKIWDSETGNLLHTLRGHNDDVRDIIWSPDGTRVVTAGSFDRTAKIWDAGGGYKLMQEDESDNLFSIVAPLPSVLDIDMLQCLIGSSKDSIVVEFIQNKGAWKFRVDSIYFQGPDADAFSLVSGIPKYIVEANNNYYAEFQFTPKRVGIHSAEIVIITQSDTLRQSIRGEGVTPSLQLVNDLIDFGAVEIQNNKDTLQVATIKNIGNAPLLITYTKHNYPNDKDFTTLSGGGSFTIQPNEIHKMDLRFLASSIGRTSGTLEFHYQGVGSPAIVQLYGQGLGGNVIIPDDSAYAGDRIKVKLEFGNQSIPLANDLITNYKVILSYNPTLLYCDEPSAKREYNKNLETIELTGKWDGTSSTLGGFDFIVGLGNVVTTEVTLEEFYWLDKDNNLIDFEVEKQSGTFTLLGICEEGGTRLLNPYSKAGITSISPNPAENLINIELSLSEFGNTELCLYNLLGEKVSTIFSESVSQKSILELNSDISKIGSGQYLLIFRTPTYTETRQLLILR